MMADSTAFRRLSAELESRWQLSVHRFDECHRRSQLLAEQLLALQHDLERREQQLFDAQGRYRARNRREAS